MTIMVVRHKVRDFAAWKAEFDTHEPVRRAAGLTNARLYRTRGAANEVLLVFDVEDMGRAEAFAASADLKSAMTAAGVIDTPDLYFLDPA